MSVTRRLHLQLGPVNAALTLWRDGDRFRREAHASNGRGFGRPGWSDAGLVVKCELMGDEHLKSMRHILTTRRPCNRSCRHLAFDDHQRCHQASFMPPHGTLTGKEAMASRRAEFLAAHDRTQNGREAVASRRAEFIAARDLTPMWAEFEAAKAEWVVEKEAAKAA